VRPANAGHPQRPQHPDAKLEEHIVAELSNLGYFVIGASDLDAWERFAVDLIGLQTGHRDPGKSLALRMDDYEQRILITRTGEDDLCAAGWELDTHDDLDAYVERLRAAGVTVTDGGRELADSRRVERVFVTEDPNGLKHEFYVGAQRAMLSDAFRSKVLVGGFNTGRLGVGHILAVARDPGAQRTVQFYRETLGLRLSDYIRMEMAPGALIDATFLHSATGRHHSLATAFMPSDKRIHHIMVQVENMDDVGLAHDRCARAGVPFLHGIGRHPNDRMFSFYVQTPSGFGLEFGWGGIVIDDANWEIKSYTRISEWGHQPPGPPPGAPAR